MVVEWKLQTNHVYFILFYFVDVISKKINTNNFFYKKIVIKNGLKKKIMSTLEISTFLL